jgi:hypothetical protein
MACHGLPVDAAESTPESEDVDKIWHVREILRFLRVIGNSDFFHDTSRLSSEAGMDFSASLSVYVLSSLLLKVPAVSEELKPNFKLFALPKNC